MLSIFIVYKYEIGKFFFLKIFIAHAFYLHRSSMIEPINSKFISQDFLIIPFNVLDNFMILTDYSIGKGYNL